MSDLITQTKQSNVSRWKKFIVPAVLIAIIAAVLAISQLFIMRESLRLDEAQTIWQTAHSFEGMLKIVAQDVHMPLYHILVHYWMILFGNGVETVRALSLLFFIISIPFVYLLARSILPKKWALVVTALFSFSPFMNWYANEARMYTLLAMFSIINQYFFVRIIQRKRGGWIGYALTAITGIFSHYFFAFNLLTQGIFYLFNRKKFAPGTFKKFTLVAAGVALAVTPWIMYFVSEGAANNTRPLLQTPSTVNFFNIFSQFLFGFQSDPVNTIIVSCWPLLVIVAFFTVRRHMKFETGLSYLIFAGFVPILLAFILSFVITPFFLSRYMVPAVAPLFIVVMWLLAQYSKKVVIIGITIWATILGITFYMQTTSAATPVRENYKSVVNYIEREATPSDIVAISSPFTVYPIEYYYKGNLQLRTIPLWDRQNPGSVPKFDKAALPEQVNALIAGHEYIYLVTSYDQGYEKDIVDYFKNNYEQIHDEAFSDSLHLYVYRVGYREAPKLELAP